MRQRTLLVVLLLVVGLAACGGDDNPAPTPRADLTAPEIIQQAVSTTNALNSFHFKLTVVGQVPGSTGLTVTGSEGDAIKPGNVNAKINAKYGGFPVQATYVNGGSDQQYILIAGVSNCWEPFPTLALDPGKAAADILANIGDRNLVGRDTAEADSYHLTGTIPAEKLLSLTNEADSGATLKVDLWVNADDLRARRILLSGPLSKTDKPDATYDIRLSDYDKVVKVELPAAENICKKK